MADLRRGNHVGTDVEKVIWAILANKSDFLEAFDRPLSVYINENYEKMFPDLFDEVFVNNTLN